MKSSLLLKKIDDLLQKPWDSIYKGNCDNMAAIVTNHLHKYSSFILCQHTLDVGNITVGDFRSIVESYPRTAAGIDSWVPSDFGLFSDESLI